MEENHTKPTIVPQDAVPHEPGRETDAKGTRCRKTGLFGGTFAPPHLGHLHAARTFLSAMALDELLIMPACLPPHKEKSPGDTPEARLAMCRSLFSTLERTVVSDYEIKKGGVSYTVETLEYLRRENPGGTVFLLCGTDMFLTLDQWFRAPDLFALARIVCMARYQGGYDETVLRQRDWYESKFGQRAVLLPGDPFVLSSTEIRAKIRRGEDLSAVLSQDVIAMIQERGLYVTESDDYGI